MVGLLRSIKESEFKSRLAVMCRFCPKGGLHLLQMVCKLWLMNSNEDTEHETALCVLCDWWDPKSKRLELMLKDAFNRETRREIFLCLVLLWVVCGSCVRRCSSMSVMNHRALCLTVSSTPDPQALLHACYSSIILYCWYASSSLLWWTFFFFSFKTLIIFPYDLKNIIWPSQDREEKS